MLFNTLKNLFLPPPPEPTKGMEESFVELLRQRDWRGAQKALDKSDNSISPAKRLVMRAELTYHQGDHAEAERFAHSALEQSPGLAEAHYVLSLLRYDAGLLTEALAQAHYARNRTPGNARILAQLGLCLIANKDYGAARDVLRQAVLLDPDNVPAINNLGIACHAMLDYGNALHYFQRALTLKPDYALALENLHSLFGIESYSTEYDSESNILRVHLQTTEAANMDSHKDQTLAELESEYDERPDDGQLALNISQRYLKNLQLEAARDVLHLALARHPDDVSLLYQAGRMANLLGQWNKSRANYERVLELDPNNVESLIGLAEVLRNLALFEEALHPVETAVSLREDANTLVQLAFAQVNACRYEDGLITCERVEALRPEYASFLATSQAVCHAYLGHFEEAFKYIEIADLHEKNNLGFSIFRGMIHLQHENYGQGWDDYRYRTFSDSKQMRLLPYPVWEGEPLVGKTILVLAEQGLGDQVMFASCLLDLLALRPREILVEANERVANTLARSFPTIRVFPSNQRSFGWIPPETIPDFYTPIADLPRHFRRSLEDFPLHTGYLRADPDRVVYWKARLDALDCRPKIGFTWKGGLQQTRRTVRSLSLEQLEYILGDDRACFVNLQYGEVQAEIADFARPRTLNIIDWPEAIADLDEFAALISALDLVITVCNTTVHYAGALHRPCWVMAPYIPEWRYGLKNEGMRWYPSVRMFRQPSLGDWNNVIERVQQSLNNCFDHSSA